MKKYIALLLAALCVLSMTGCQSKFICSFCQQEKSGKQYEMVLMAQQEPKVICEDCYKLVQASPLGGLALMQNGGMAQAQAQTQTQNEATTNSRAPMESSVVDKGYSIPEDGDAELLDGAVTLFDGQVAVSFVSCEETDKIYLSIRIDNLSDKVARTEGTPGVVADGTNKPVNPMGANQKIGLVEIPAGTYHIISYKGEEIYMTANELVISGQISLLDGDDKEKTEYELTVTR